MSIQYTPILEHKTMFPNSKYTTYLTNGDEFYDTLDEALSEAIYQTTGLRGSMVTPIAIIGINTKTGESRTLVMLEDMPDAMRQYIESKLTDEELSDLRADAIADDRIDERQGA